MDSVKLYKLQEKERKEQAEAIIKSSAKKKIVVSGPGTGKTYLFREILEQDDQNNKIVLTFVRRLINDISQKVSLEDTCKTFHEFSKGLLHSQKGLFDLQPYLTEIIQRDAVLLGLSFDEFDTKFQELDEYGPEIPFYLGRSDYYQTVSFNDSVYRLYKSALEDKDIIPEYSQIIIDEYQDFNKLETEFIKILEERGPILIAGDDDQALYDGRSASSKYIKQLYNSGLYERFKPKYCSRCTEAIISAANSFLKNAQKHGRLSGRISKKYKCYLPDKEKDSKKYRQIDFVETSLISTVAKYAASEIKNSVDKEDIADSYKDNEEYPTVLIIGPAHYLREVHKVLLKSYGNIQFSPAEDSSYSIIDGYKLLIEDEYSNLGWRIIAEFSVSEQELINIVAGAEGETAIIDLLSEKIVNKHKTTLKLIRKISDKESFKETYLKSLKRLNPDNLPEIKESFMYKEEEQEDKPIDKTKPSILLTSYKGAKGLSGGHVYILGVHDRMLPRDKNNISDIEVAQFYVALTRAKKKLTIVNNRWFNTPVNKKGEYIEQNERSIFIDWIPNELINNLGYKKSEDIKINQ